VLAENPGSRSFSDTGIQAFRVAVQAAALVALPIDHAVGLVEPSTSGISESMKALCGGLRGAIAMPELVTVGTSEDPFVAQSCADRRPQWVHAHASSHWSRSPSSRKNAAFFYMAGVPGTAT
jgi:hypothetical protein